jgi:hypothetical protein
MIRKNSMGSQLRVDKAASGDWLLRFDYLRPGSGGLFAVTHDGKDEKAVGLTGELVDGNHLQRITFPRWTLYDFVPKSIRKWIGDRWAHRLAILWFGIFETAALYALLLDIVDIQALPAPVLIALFIGFAFQVLFLGQLLRGVRENVPSGLRPFDPSDSP